LQRLTAKSNKFVFYFAPGYSFPSTRPYSRVRERDIGSYIKRDDKKTKVIFSMENGDIIEKDAYAGRKKAPVAG